MAWWKLSYLALYYSFLKGSWEEAIKNRFKHVRKYDAKKRRLTAPVNSSNSTDAKNEVTPVKRTKRNDFWNEIPIVSKEIGCVMDEHLAELLKECSRPRKSQDTGKIKQLMTSTFEHRRSEILTKPVPVKEILQQYPPLATVSGVRKFLVLSRLHSQESV